MRLSFERLTYHIVVCSVIENRQVSHIIGTQHIKFRTFRLRLRAVERGRVHKDFPTGGPSSPASSKSNHDNIETEEGRQD